MAEPLSEQKIRFFGLALGRYRSVLSVPHVHSLVASAFLAYLGFTGRTVAIVLFVHDRTGSFAAAGTALAAASIGGAIFAPVRGRLIDTFGQSRVIIPLGIIHSVGLAAMIPVGVYAHSAASLVALAALTGATFPAIFAAMRSVWSKMFRLDPRLPAAYALESMLQETSIVFGPVIAGALIALEGPAAGIGACALLSLVGALWYAASPISREWKTQAPSVRGVGALVSPGVRALMISMALVGVSEGVIQVEVPALASKMGHEGFAGFMLGIMGVGSMVGALWYGGRQHRRGHLAQFIAFMWFLTVALVLLMTFGLGRSLFSPGFTLAMVGLCTAPVFVSLFAILDDVAPEGTGTEAFTWISSAQVGGLAVGAALTGPVLQTHSLQDAFALAPIAVGLAACFTLLQRRSLLPVSEPSRGPAP